MNSTRSLTTRARTDLASFAPAEEIGEYFKKVASNYALYPYIQFNRRVMKATWDDTGAKWILKISHTQSGMEQEAKGDIFINAGGILNDWKWPDIEGLDTFQGTRLHTAAWVRPCPISSSNARPDLSFT